MKTWGQIGEHRVKCPTLASSSTTIRVEWTATRTVLPTTTYVTTPTKAKAIQWVPYPLSPLVIWYSSCSRVLHVRTTCFRFSNFTFFSFFKERTTATWISNALASLVPALRNWPTCTAITRVRAMKVTTNIRVDNLAASRGAKRIFIKQHELKLHNRATSSSSSSKHKLLKKTAKSLILKSKLII